MATLCKNCSHALVFNPASQKLECSYCGSSFTAEEVEAESKQYRQDLQAESMETVYGILFAWLLLGESPALREVIGGLIIIGAVIFQIRNKKLEIRNRK